MCAIGLVRKWEDYLSFKNALLFFLYSFSLLLVSSFTTLEYQTLLACHCSSLSPNPQKNQRNNTSGRAGWSFFFGFPFRGRFFWSLFGCIVEEPPFSCLARPAVSMRSHQSEPVLFVTPSPYYLSFLAGAVIDEEIGLVKIGGIFGEGC